MAKYKVMIRRGSSVRLSKMGSTGVGGSISVTGIDGPLPALGEVIEATVTGTKIKMKHNLGTADGMVSTGNAGR